MSRSIQHLHNAGRHTRYVGAASIPPLISAVGTTYQRTNQLDLLSNVIQQLVQRVDLENQQADVNDVNKKSSESIQFLILISEVVEIIRNNSEFLHT